MEMLNQFLELNNKWQQGKYTPLTQAFSYHIKLALTGFVMSLMDLQVRK
jgi:hypothetical protein